MVDYPKLACLSIFSLLLASPLSPAHGVQRTVVLTNGNVIQGDVRQINDHVVIRSTSSEIRVPNSEIDLVARDLQAAYRAKAAAISGPSSRRRTQLIRWCLRVGLPAEARQQLGVFQQASPRHPDLEHLALQIDSYRAEMKNTTLPTKSPLPLNRQYALDRLDQLSKETVSEFVRHVQPLMSNRCGLAGCHGKASGSKFSLLTVGSRRPDIGTTHGNLGAVLQQIGNTAPQQTLLWMSANSAHGKLKKKPMSAAELNRLAAWIQRVHGELEQEMSSQTIAQTSYEAPIDDGVDPSRQLHLTRQPPP